jgi:formylglycine-generating enzyme
MKKLLSMLLLIMSLACFSMAFAAGPVEVVIDEKAARAAVSAMEFVPVKGGCFKMGDTFGNGGDDERPAHEVCVDNFQMGRYPVTQGQWKAIMGTSPSFFKECGDNCPVENVTSVEILEFIGKVNQKADKGHRLPTEAEWEYAARSGGKDEKWAGTGNAEELKDYAWYSGNSGFKTHPVGQKKPNDLGLYDMTGNVWQLVSDLYARNYYKKSPMKNPMGPSSGKTYVLRGGSWFLDSEDIRVATRLEGGANLRSNDFGFRLVRTR